jgi:glycosyltransferase involved in cell wall biosynthesis
MNKEKIAILIPCYNEEQGIAKVLDNIPYQPLETIGLEPRVIVIDNNSSDRTAEIAASKGVHVVKAQNRFVNTLYTSLVRRFYGANITDVLSGFFAWRGDVVVGMREHLQSGGFSIEMEMISKLVKLDYAIYSVPITYNIREGETKIESLKDGVKILLTFSRNLFWAPSKALVTAQVQRGLINASQSQLFKVAETN